jgi:hypothetical protein
VLAALAWDLSKRQTEPFPFASQHIARGSVITEDLIEWKPVPIGSMTRPVLVNASSTVDIATGDPITRSITTASPPLPAGWWSVPIDLPQGVPSGASIRVIFPDGNAATGVVTQPASDDGFGVSSPATVGFPESVADVVAQLATAGDLVVLVEP